jgi:hypothetical protein
MCEQAASQGMAAVDALTHNLNECIEHMVQGKNSA